MPILAFCEKGLIIDVFGSKPTILKCRMFEQKKDALVTYHNNILKFFNFPDLILQKQLEMPDVSEIKLSSNGKHLGILLNDKTLMIFKNFNKINTIANVEMFDISDCFYSISIKNEAAVYNFDNNEPEYSLKSAVKSIFSVNSCVVLITEKVESQKIFVYKNKKIHTILNLPNIYRTIIKSKNAGSSNDDDLLLLVDTEYTKNSYYPESTLFYLSFNNIDQMASSCNTKDKNSPEIAARTTDFIILRYKSLLKIHSVGFLKNSFYVCFGDQPALLLRFDFNGKLIKEYPKSIGNSIIFNSKEDKLINAGLGNLPGTIQVYNKGELTCSFEMLGASIVSWLNNDSYFMIAITNYFKSQNKIAIYDYYGVLLEEMECKSLITARVYGELEEEIVVSPPENMIKTETVARYVPPHLQIKTPVNVKPNPIKKTKNIKRTKEAIQSELDVCLKLKERLKNGEELSLEDENKVFSIKSLEEELKNMLNN